MAGRAKDMALSPTYYFSHSLRLCPAYDIGDAFWSWGYRGFTGEIIAMNGGYGYDPYPYHFGCDITETTCTGPDTVAPDTVAMAARQFMTSAGHRAVVLDTRYDRFACGAWKAPNADHYYVCLYAFGPGTAVEPTPTPTPEPTPTPTPTPEPTPTPTPTPEPTPAWDETAPVVTSLTAPSVVTSVNRSFVAGWTATDNDAVTDYAVWIRKGSGAWSEQPAQTATSKAFSGRSPGTWHVGVRARDAGGNWSELRQAAVVVPTDDRAWAFSSGNVRRKGTHFLNGTYTTTRRAGARMTIKFTGSSFVLIGTSAVNRGKLRVVIDGRAYIVDEGYYKGSRARSTHYRVILLNKTLKNKAHTVVITNLGTRGRPTVDVDGVAWKN